MGKLLDERNVEFAFLQRSEVNYNQHRQEVEQVVDENGFFDNKTIDFYYHQVIFEYILLDADRNVLGTRKVYRSIEIGNTKDSIIDCAKRIATSLPAFVAEDKLNFSGYRST